MPGGFAQGLGPIFGGQSARSPGPCPEGPWIRNVDVDHREDFGQSYQEPGELSPEDLEVMRCVAFTCCF